MTDSARRDKRYPSKQLLLVRCESWAEFAQFYAADISRGGMFILTEEPLPIFSEIKVDIQLPEGQLVELHANVVHVLDTEQAAREGRQAGVGVQFVALDPMQRQLITQLVEFSGAEAHNPAASFASYMFAAATSLPPSKVLSALPPAPSDAPKPSSQSSTRAAAGAGASAGSGRPARSSARAADGSRPNSSPQLRAQTGKPRTGEQQAARPPEATAEGEPVEAAPAPQAPAVPLDVDKLKFGVTHLAHKRFDQAIKVFQELVRETHGDAQAKQWLHTAQARVKLKQDEPDAAVEHYKKVLDVDENNHEARKFVREHYTRKRLNSIPFGRYFVKKT